MATQYPGDIDDFPSVTAEDLLSSPMHPTLHNDNSDALIAVENTLGTDPQGVFDSVSARLDAQDARIISAQAGLAPFYAGTRSGSFYSTRGLYLPVGAQDKLDQARTTIQDALASQSRARVCWIGHSIVFGYGASPGITDNVIRLTSRAQQSGEARTGLVIGAGGFTQTIDDARITKDSGWAWVTSTPQLHSRCAQANQSYTYTSRDAGTVVDIYTFENSGAWKYQIDGGAATTITPAGTQTARVTTVTGLANTTHAVTITTNTASPTYLLGISVRSEVGLEVANFGYYASLASDWTPQIESRNWYAPVTCVDIYDPEIVLIQLGANELIHDKGAAELATQLAIVINEVLNVQSRQVLLIADPPIESPAKPNWLNDFYPVLYDMADQFSLPLLDFTSRWGRRGYAAPLDYYYDQWHPTPSGYADLNELVSGMLL